MDYVILLLVLLVAYQVHVVSQRVDVLERAKNQNEKP